MLEDHTFFSKNQYLGIKLRYIPYLVSLRVSRMNMLIAYIARFHIIRKLKKVLIVFLDNDEHRSKIKKV